jgi:uncharacterized membrane protein
MLEFFGRFHPVFVHLPIGILLLACLFILLSFKAQFASLKSSIPIILWLGALSAVISCATGYLLANSGDYDGELVNNHQWMGIVVAIIAILLWLLYQKITSNLVLGTISVVLIVLISITGHLGGSLTHGANYLTEPLKAGNNDSAIPPIANVQEAFVYKDAIQPLLQNRCYGCHGSAKQKGKLRLDGEAYILKGGKTAKAIEPGKADESELIKRLLLPLSDEGHMAPKEKTQLTTDEITLLKWWIDNGADFKKKFKMLPQTTSMKQVIARLQTGEMEATASDLPANDIGAANTQAIAALNNAGVTVVAVSQNSNYLSANFINVKAFTDSVTNGINQLKGHLIWLKLANKAVNDKVLSAFKDCKKLTRISLNNTEITNQGLEYLSGMEELQSLSLVGTKITLDGLLKLNKLKKLKNIYLYQTNIHQADWPKLKAVFPMAKLDSGNYKVPTLPHDTVLLK